MALMRRFAAALVLAALCSVAPAQTVYKCATPGGVMFSQTPCGQDAEEVDTSRAQMRGTAPNVQAISDAAGVSDIRYRCAVESDRVATYYDQVAREIGREIESLRRDLARSRNNVAGATRDVGLRAQIDGAERRRAENAQAAREEQASIRDRCDAEVREEMEQQQRRREAVPVSRDDP